MKKNRTQTTFLAQLEETPNVSSACKQVGLSRQTVYRWRAEDPDFAEKMDKAQALGESYIDDFVESKLMSQIQKEHFPAIRYYLDKQHPKYNAVDSILEKKQKLQQSKLHALFSKTTSLEDEEYEKLNDGDTYESLLGADYD